MPARTTLEHKSFDIELSGSYPVGTVVEVTHDLPDDLRTFTYIGSVAIRPEEKATQLVQTNKFGGDFMIPVAATYTIKTEVMLKKDYVETEDGLELLQVTNCPNVADLIFDPTHPAYSIELAVDSVPTPRQQQ